MAKRKRSTTENVIKQRIKEGRGKGKLKEYKPWLNIQDVPSTGQVNRKTSWTTGREHQLMSELELHYLFVFDWMPFIVEIREQFPLLPHGDTLVIAEELGIQHPTDPSTNEPIVVTTDFVITVEEGGMLTDRAVAIKPARELQNPRVIEKLEIERVYWQTVGVHWCIGTERDLDMVFVRNVQLLHDYRQLHASTLSTGQLEDIVTELTKRLHQPVALAALAADCDKRLGLDRGTALSVAYHLMATRRWRVDMCQPINASKPFVMLSSDADATNLNSVPIEKAA